MPAEGAAAKLRSGFLWNVGLNIFREIAQFGTMLVLVRRLDPSAYGEFGLVTSIIGFLTVLSFRSFLEHTFQVPHGEEPDYQNIFTIGGFIQGTIFLVTNIAALVMMTFPKYAPAAPLLQAMSVIFILDWMHEFRTNMLERDLDWSTLRLIQAVGIVFSNAVALVMALLGAGVYALLVPGLLVFTPTIYDLFFRAKWRPTWKCSWVDFQPAWRYGLTRMGSGLLLTGRQLAESAMIVHYLGFAGAGIYGRAIGIATIACLRIPSYLTRNLYPVLARVPVGTPARSRAGTLVLQSILWLIVPMAAVMLVLAEPVIRMLYGTKWLAAAPLIPMALAITGLSAVGEALSILLLACGRQRTCLVADLVSSGGVLLSLGILLPQGIQPYLAGIAGAQLFSSGVMLVGLHQADALEFPRFARVLVMPLVASASLLAATAPLYLKLPVEFWSPLLICLFSVGFAAVYLVFLRVAAGTSLGELVNYLPGRTRLQRLLWLPA